MKNKLAFVLGGGGARGALQVGALRAVLEAGYQPDLLVGTSVGAVNASFLALNGVCLENVESLEKAWHEAAAADLLPSNYLWLTVRSLFNRPASTSVNRMRDFFISHGLLSDLRFADIQGVQLILVAADLNAGCTVCYGDDLQECVLDGLLASTSLPPWVTPLERDGKLLLDGGFVSTLPIESALNAGAAEIIAFDLSDSRSLQASAHGFAPFLTKMIASIEQRQTDLEKALAQARRVPVRHLQLRSLRPVPVWDFHRTGELIEEGYAIAHQEIQNWTRSPRPWWRVFIREKQIKDSPR